MTGICEACAVPLLPSVLTESSVLTLSKKGKRKNFWKPSVAESISSFVDIQMVGIRALELFCLYLPCVKVIVQ